MAHVVDSVCPLDCPDTCSLSVTIDGDRITRVDGSQRNPYTAGYICAKVRRYAERVYSPLRLQYPQRRTGPKGEGQFERISWEEALDTIASEMKRIQEKYGQESLFFMYASGENWKGPDGRDPMRRLMRMFGGYVDYFGSYSTACYGAAMPYITGGAGNSANHC